MVNVVVLQGAAIPGSGSVFYLQILGGSFSGAHDVEVRVSGSVAEYVQTVIESGLLCVVKGQYVPSASQSYVQAESVAFLRDKLDSGDPLWG
jgi:hypothetical protein